MALLCLCSFGSSESASPTATLSEGTLCSELNRQLLQFPRMIVALVAASPANFSLQSTPPNIATLGTGKKLQHWKNGGVTLYNNLKKCIWDSKISGNTRGGGEELRGSMGGGGCNMFLCYTV